MDTDTSIYPATHLETESLVRLANSAYRGPVSRQGWTTEADLLEGQRTDRTAIQAIIDKAPSEVILCMKNLRHHELIGCVHLKFFADVQGRACHLGLLTIKPDLQAAGLGRALLETAESFAQTRGAQRMVLSVIHVRDSLMNWYERRGYLKTGATEPFPYGDERFGLPKRNDLHFVVFEKQLR